MNITADPRSHALLSSPRGTRTRGRAMRNGTSFRGFANQTAGAAVHLRREEAGKELLVELFFGFRQVYLVPRFPGSAGVGRRTD